MATAGPIPQMENLEWHKHRRLLISVSEKCNFAAKYLDNQKDVIHRIRVAALAAGAVGLVASFFTLGATLLLCGAALVMVLAKLAEISYNALKTEKMYNFERDWEKAKSIARYLTMEQIPGDCDVEHLKEWAKENLDRDSAEAVVFFLSAPSACDPNTTDRLKRLNQNQLELLVQSLVHVIIANLSAFELLTASLASKRADAAPILRTLSGDMEKLVKQEDMRQKEMSELRMAACEESSEDEPSEKKRKGVPLDIIMKQEEKLCVNSKQGGKFQLRNSDIILDIPPGAIPVKEVHIQAAVCTDFDCIHSTFHLDDDEDIVSPLVEFKLMKPLHMLKPVSIHLPHLVPEKSDMISVYHVYVNEHGIFTKERITDYTTSSYQEGNTEEQKPPYITIKTRTFSYFFICKFCNSKEKRFPELWAAVSGDFQPNENVLEDQEFTVQLNIWDRRLTITDFRMDSGISPNIGKIRYLQLLGYLHDTKLHVKVNTQPGEHLAPSRHGGTLTEREKVFDIPHQLTCKKCLKKGRYSPMCKEWLFRTRSRKFVSLSIDVEHRGYQQDCIKDSFLFHIKRERAIPHEVIEKLQRLGPQQHARAAQEMDISTQQLERVVRHLVRGETSTGDHRAQAAEPQPSASANRQDIQPSPHVSIRQRRLERLPLGIPETRQLGERDCHGSQVPQAADISFHRSSRTIPKTTQLHELKE